MQKPWSFVVKVCSSLGFRPLNLPGLVPLAKLMILEKPDYKLKPAVFKSAQILCPEELEGQTAFFLASFQL